MRRFANLLFLLLAATASARPLASPQLRPEISAHLGQVVWISTDAEGRFVATGSDDKTVRLWDASTGNLLRVLRPPIGPEQTGSSFGGALSPDGKVVVVGVVGAVGTGLNSSLYVFDRVTGEVLRRLGPMQSWIRSVAFAPDGSRVAVGLDDGVRVYSTKDWSEIWREDGLGRAWSLAFDSHARLAVATGKGTLYLYDAKGKQVVKKDAPGGKSPFPILFSVDGKQLALGHQDQAALNLLTADKLTSASELKVSDFTGDTGALAWAGDGSLVVASKVADKPTARIWPSGGKGKPHDIALPTVVSVLAALRGGKVAYGGFDGSWGVVSTDGKVLVEEQPPVAAFTQSFEPVLTDATGSRISVVVDGSHRAEFSVVDLSLKFDPPSNGALHGPARTSNDSSLRLDGCPGEPRLNGEAGDVGRCRAGAIAPDGTSAAFGQSFWLIAVDRHGVMRWRTPVSAVYGVNYSGDGRWIIATLGDSTVRWYRAADGAEVLALLVLNDGRRWVAWTPQGHYAASEGAEDLVGWHVDHGDDRAADFFPASRLRAGHFRPDVISRILSSPSEAQAVADADGVSGQQEGPSGAGLPPVVSILSPEENASVAGKTVKLTVKVRSPSGDPITSVRALVDGREIAKGRGLNRKGDVAAGPDADSRIITVPVSGDATVAVIAETAGRVSEPAVVHLHASAPGDVVRPRLRALVVGIGAYARGTPALPYAAQDARDFAAALASQQKRLYESVETKVLVDGQATRANLLDALEWLEQETARGDVAAVFFEGYALTDPASGRTFYVPTDGDLSSPRRTLLSDAEVRETLAAIPGKVLAFLDVRPPPLERKTRGVPGASAFITELASAENGVVVFSAAGAGRAALESADWGGAAFARAVIDGISGKADERHSGRVTVNMLSLYIQQRVAAMTRGAQAPVTAKPATVPDFPIALSP